MDRAEPSGRAQPPGERLRVFLSYARGDGAALAEELLTGLELLGFDSLLDRHDIAAAEDWEHRLATLIRQSDTVVFLISPLAVRSPRCQWEVDKALALGKRLVPVVAAAVPESEVPEALRRLNYVQFDGGRSFARGLAQLADALRLDLGWIREHTRLAELAARWEERGRDDALLLRGVELAGALQWRQQWRAGAPAVTDAQRLFIDLSGEAAAQRESAERQRVEQMAEANASRAQALATREEALVALRRRTLIGGGAAAGLSAALAFAGWRMVEAERSAAAARKSAAEARERSLEEAVQREAERTDLAGQVAAYSASPGETALDESGFSAALIERLDKDRASLSVALRHASTRVYEKTRGHQRPYIASDLNGDVYFRRGPASRRRAALVVTLEEFEGLRLPGTIADGTAWHAFFEACGIRVQWLRNPTRDVLMAAVHGLQLAERGIDSTWVRTAGVLASPGLPASGAPAGRTPAEPARPAPPENTFISFVFSGVGYRIDGQDSLICADSRLNENRLDAVMSTVVRVQDIAALLRERAAASCLVLDTQFTRFRLKSP